MTAYIHLTLRDNEALLLSLGLSVPSPPPPPEPKAMKTKLIGGSDLFVSPNLVRTSSTRQSVRASTSTPIYKQGLKRNPRASLPASTQPTSVVDDDVSYEQQRLQNIK